MLTTQADFSYHDGSDQDQDILQLGFFYRLRTCAADTLNDMCTGEQIAQELTDKNQVLNSRIPVTKTDFNIVLQLNQEISVGAASCIIFSPHYVFSHTSGAQIGTSYLYDGSKLIVNVQTEGTAPSDGNAVNLEALIQPEAFPSANDNSTSSFIKLRYMMGCPSRTEVI